MSTGHATENWGKIEVDGDVLRMNTVKAGTTRQILQIPLKTVSSVSGMKSDLTLNIQSTPSGKGNVALTAVRFAIPLTCIGFEQSENAGKELLSLVDDAVKRVRGGATVATPSGAATAGDPGVMVAIFDDVIMSYPAGKYMVSISTTQISFEDKRKKSSLVIPHSELVCMYLCNIPASFEPSGDDPESEQNQYVTIILKNPVRIGATQYQNIVFSFPSGLVLSPEYAWSCELKTQEEINKVLGLEGKDSILLPTMSGKVSEIVLGALKTITRIPTYGGINKNFKTVLSAGRHSVVRCVHRGTDGYLYVLSTGILFLHRPASRYLYADMSRVVHDESTSGTSTFQIVVFVLPLSQRAAGREEKLTFASIDKKEEQGLLAWFKEKHVKVERIGMGVDDELGDEEAEEDSDLSEENSSEDEKDGSESGSDGEEDGEKKSHKRHRHKKHRSHHKHDREDGDRKKKHHRHKKHRHE